MGSLIDRRTVMTGLAAAASVAPMAEAMAGAGAVDPDLGPNVFVADPRMPADLVQSRLDHIFASMERAEFSEERHAILFKPGRYACDVNVGFYTQVMGLAPLPGGVFISGHVHAEADWAKGMALTNFWRGVENMTVRPPDGQDRWAVSQASPYRRVHLMGDLALDDGGWSSGGFLADCLVDGTIRSGTQQQWFTRSSAIGDWRGSNWNMMFMGVAGAPPTTFPEPPMTSLPDVPVMREKPFLQIDPLGRWGVRVPSLRRHAKGPTWSAGPPGKVIPLSRFLIARPGMSGAFINAALARGQSLLLTPGIYPLAEPIRVKRPGTVVLGLGLATLRAENGTPALVVDDVPGVSIAGLLIDAGERLSPVLVQVGPRGSARDHSADPILLADVFFRVGGARVGKVETALEVNSRHVIGDHLWIWRADHGDHRNGRVHVGWDESVADQGLVVHGDDVAMHGLFVEHFRRDNVLWNGERGTTYFFQNELPYDPPSQTAYRAGSARDWAAYRVADHVREHHAVGLGIYANFTADPSIVVPSAIVAPERPGVTFESVTTISLGGGKGTIAHLVNGAGEAARPGATRQTLRHYP